MSNDTRKYSVLIIDYMNFDSPAEIPYLFSKAGCHVTVFCDEKSWIIQNSFFDRHIMCESKDPRWFAKTVVDIVSQGAYDQICMVDDVAIRIMNEYIIDDALALKILPISKLENRKFLGSKSEFSKFCSEHNFLSPEFEIYKEGCAIGFPILVKVDKSQGGKGTFHCKDNKEFDEIIARLDNTEKNNLVLQKYIQGDLIGIEAYFYQGVLLASACSTVVQTVGGEFSISSERVYKRIPELEAIIKKFGEELGAHGFASISFVREKTTGKYYMFEFDSRTNAWLRIANLVGVDFSKAITAGFGEEDLFLSQDLTPKTLWQFPRDFIRVFVRKDAEGVGKWFLNKQNRWQVVPWYDIKLLYAVVSRGAWVAIKKLWK